MKVSLNKELQKKLDAFLETKDAKIYKLLEILNLKEFTFSEEEINQVEEIYKKNQDLYDYVYIGEAVIKILGGFWFIGKFKRDSAYEKHIILGRKGEEDSPRIYPASWLYYIRINELGRPLGSFIYSP